MNAVEEVIRNTFALEVFEAPIDATIFASFNEGAPTAGARFVLTESGRVQFELTEHVAGEGGEVMVSGEGSIESGSLVINPEDEDAFGEFMRAATAIRVAINRGD